MTIDSCICASFRQEMLLGEHDIESDTLKMALYNEDASLGASTTAYTTIDEMVQAGYTAGGKTLSNVAVSTDSGIVVVDFDNLVWTGVTFNDDPPRAGLIYRVSDGKAIAVINFGSNQYVASGNFEFDVPPATANTAILKFA